MARIFIFTAGRKSGAQKHLDDSIRKAIDRDLVYSALGAEHRDALERVEAQGGGFFAWGAEPGPRNRVTWELIQPGDWAFCYFDKGYRYVAKILEKFDAPALATQVWGVNDQTGNTWQYMYFLMKPQPVDRPARELTEELPADYQGFTALSDDRIARIEERYGSVDNFVAKRLASSAEPQADDFLSGMRRLQAERAVLVSTLRGHRYFVSSVDDSGCVLERVDANEPERVTLSYYEAALDRVRANGGTLPWSGFTGSIIARTAVLQGPSLGLAADRDTVIDIAAPEQAVSLFIDWIKNLRVNQSGEEEKKFKPAVLATVIDAIDRGELGENRIKFEWLAPRVAELLRRRGIEASEQQIAYGFFYLGSDWFWTLCYRDVRRLIEPTAANLSAVRERIQHARMKDAFWEVLQDPKYRAEVRLALEARWFPPGRVWWVNQGFSYERGRDGGYLWAPRRTEKGQTYYHWTNMDSLRRGDVILHYADGSLRALGEVTEEATDADRPAGELDEQWAAQGRQARVKYFELERPVGLAEIPSELRAEREGGPFATTGGVKQGYLFGLAADLADGIRRRFAERWPAESPWGGTETTSMLEKLANELLLAPSWLAEVVALLEHKRQVIFYGPPGTGKTYVAKRLAETLTGSADHVRIVQFHPAYSYEDFVEGYRPRDSSEGGFTLVPGPLKRLADEARRSPGETFILLIDEINRGNAPKILGELYLLLEYREEAVSLLYSPEVPFSLPKNLWFIGTMNTADRSIALIDAALRRRFHFVPFFPDEQPISGVLRRWLQANKPSLEWVADAVEKANAQLGNRHGAIGPAHFLRSDLTEEWVKRIWKYSIVPYLEEQFFGQEEELERFQLGRLRESSNETDEGGGG